MNQELKPKSSKVKLKLEQPYIMCAGRDKVECYYRGKIVEKTKDILTIEFKSFGEKTIVEFDRKYGFCLTTDWQDLKIIDQQKYI
jgi:hypothetical protein